MIRDFHNININTIDNVVLVLRDKVLRVRLKSYSSKNDLCFFDSRWWTKATKRLLFEVTGISSVRKLKLCRSNRRDELID